jgi:long-chain acyl-CoA synthetase
MQPTRIYDLLDRFKNLFPENCALATKKEGKWIKYSGSKYNEISHHVCYGLIGLGLSKGDKIVTITNNRPEWNFMDMGMAMAGLVHVPVYTSLTDDEYRYIFEHSDAKVVMVCDSKFFERLKPVCDKLDKVEHFFTFDEVAGARNWSEIVNSGQLAGREIQEEAERRKKEINEDELASIIYTSGTTGVPKGVMLSHRNLVKNFLEASRVFNLGPDDRFLSILPLCHVGGRLGNYQTQYSGASIYYAESMGTIAINLKEIKATGFDAVPRILEKIYDNVIAKGRSLSGFKKLMFFWAVDLGLKYQPFGINSPFYYLKLKIADKMIFSKWREALGGEARIVGCGGASLQPRLERIFWASGLKILNMYGLTETSPIITINRQHKDLCMLGSVGALIEGVEIKIADDGEILCRGHNVMMGYYKDEELSRQAFDSDGWFKTGDVGRIDKDKFLMVTDRKKEIFKLSSGKFIAPQLLENRLKESVFIDQVMVFGEHQKFASAIIVPDISYLKGFCKERGITEFDDIGKLIENKIVTGAIGDELKKINSTMADHERIMRTRLVPDIWSPATGELSASLKLKRKTVEEKYKSLIESVYPK